MIHLIQEVYADCVNINKPTTGPVNLKDCLPLGIGNYSSAGQFFSRLEAPAFSIAATAVIVYFVVGSVRWIMSGGNKEAVANARGMIIHAIIGFVLLILLFLVVEYLPRALGAAYYIISK